MLNIHNWALGFDKILCPFSHLNKAQIKHMGPKINLMYFDSSVKKIVP